MAPDGNTADRPRRPTLGDLRRYLAWRELPGASEPEDPEALKSRSRAFSLVEFGLRYGDRTMRRMGILERLQLRPELERMLRRRVREDWTPEGVRDLVDLVLGAWGATDASPKPPP
jgi:hypothetical protein